MVNPSEGKYISVMPRWLLVASAPACALLGVQQLSYAYAGDGIGRLVSIVGAVLWGLLALFWLVGLRQRRSLGRARGADGARRPGR